MTAAPSLWTKHRPLARMLARDWDIPGMDRDDVQQEALIALWLAARSYDKTKGANFPTWARRVIGCHLGCLLRTATREKRRAVTVQYRPETDGRLSVQVIPSELPEFTQLELEAMQAQADGSYDWRDRRMENASQSALRKLRAA